MAKKKRRMSKEELRAPDAFEKQAEAAWKKIEPHRAKIGVALGVVLVAGIGWSIYSGIQAGEMEERSGELATALHPLTAAIWDPEVDGKEQPDGTTPTKPPGETFKTEADAHKAAVERIGKYLSEHSNAPGVNAAKLGAAGLKIGDDAKAGAADLEGWISANSDNRTTSLVQLLAGRAQSAAGNTEAARGHFEAVVKSQETWLKATALAALGDLDHPMMAPKGSKGDAAASRKNYEEAVKYLGAEPPSSSPFPFPSASGAFKREIESKLSTLP